RGGRAGAASERQWGWRRQRRAIAGSPEGGVRLGGWSESDGLRRPHYEFTGVTPDHYSVRISPQLVGLGLLEAVPESALEALEDPEDGDGDGISGRLRLVTD